MSHNKNKISFNSVHVHGTTVVADGGHGHVTTTVVKPVSSVQSSASAVSSASSSASSSTNGNTNYVVSGNIDNNIYATPVKGGPTKYDDIFNVSDFWNFPFFGI